MRREWLIVAATATALLLGGCGAEHGDRGTRSASAAPGDYPGDPSAGPEDVVRQYVTALNDRDGKAFCGSIAPYVAGLFDIAGRAPDNDLPKKLSCPQFIRAFIGYVEDCCPPRFVRADVGSLRSSRKGDLVRVDAEITLHQKDTGRGDHPVTHRLHDVIWLARLDGAWRVARLSAVAGAASISTPFASNDVDDQVPLTRPPDVAALQRAYERRLAANRSYLRRRTASFKAPGRAASCPRGVTIDDPEGDVGEGAQGARRVPARGDLRSVSVAVERGRGLCLTFRTAADIRGPMRFDFGAFSFDFRRSTVDPVVEVEMRADGAARVTNGRGNEDKPTVVPAALGVEGKRLTVRIAGPALDARARRLHVSLPPFRLTRFAFNADTVVGADTRGEVRDQLGTGGEPGTHVYPGGRSCRLVNYRCQ